MNALIAKAFAGPEYKTHVANGSCLNIWVMCDADRAIQLQTLTLGGKNDNGKASSNLENKQHIVHTAQSQGFTKIAPGKVASFEPFAPNSDTVIFITVFSEKPDGTLELICSCYPRKADRSVKIDQNFTICPVKYGTIWQDEIQS